MRAFLFNLSLVSCSLFVLSVTADAHPHKSGVIHHGPSLESYQIELDFSSNHWVQDDPGSNIKVAEKNKNDKGITSTKPNKSKTRQKSQRIRKQQKEHKK
ncbi:MAG TPA: hypothetical protein EYN83_07010 [Nitrospinaceae bacterium]|jgi:hypothetical protein|nr:hypothetical protein [Nitrospinaceae bacterium]